ncbi:hypothetical protein [Nitrosopumilus sp.]|uniref:hypothetical protein n=1 Tax=Nitrosopumilus sp. TaxID=2024843 RepID=UPI00247E22E0|nr:hypothetical protein [Nitrosopumilus sp.]MCV0409370.1 hypothetical protein [Nitrosopumilus sp.]
MKKKIHYEVMDKHAARIRELVENERYRNSDVFIDTAVNILLTWESDHPEDTMKIMQSMMPFTPIQEKFMKQMMKDQERERHFGKGEHEEAIEESEKQKTLAISDHDHVRLQSNIDNVLKFIARLEISKPNNVYEYDGYPLLFRFYSRFFPVKIVMAVLANMLYEKNQTKVKLTDFRAAAYDIAEEISSHLTEIEKQNNIPRNKKISTGLPKKGQEDEDIEKIAQAQKRFKDQYIGKLRKDRETGEEFVEGAPGALGLIYVFEENGEKFVSMTEKGRKFALMYNPIISGNYKENALTKEESEFIINELIPVLELEKQFIDTALITIEKHNGKERITDVLDEEFLKTFKKFKAKNPKKVADYALNNILTLADGITKKRIVGWRVATMGRISELRIVNWEINSSGESEYSLP